MNWKRSAMGALFVVPVLGLLGWGLTRNPNEVVSPLPGRPAPNFALQVFAPGEGSIARPAGTTLALNEMRGKVVVLNFWASWCLAVLYNDQPNAGTKWIGEMGGQSYPSVLDPGSRTAIDFGLYGVPETFIIDGSGRVAYKHTGPVSSRVLSMKIDSLLSTAGAQGADTTRK
jgi:cytochrome c biogenesis protein CcmG/thiol:disulfide interchange protein DsbE